MMHKFNFEDFRQPWETGPHWELKKEFVEKYQDMFEEDRLLCLAQAYANVVLMNCCYPDPVMRQIAELAKPLQLRKKFQNDNSSNEAANSDYEQPKVSEKLKSIYGQSKRPFKQVKFCASKEQYNSPLSTDSEKLQPSSSQQFKDPPLLSTSPQHHTQSLSQTSMIAPLNEIKELSVPNQQSANSLSSKSAISSVGVSIEDQGFCSIKDASSPLSKTEEDIISVLGLAFIQDFSTAFKLYGSKIGHPVGAILAVIQKLGLVKDHSFDVDVDPVSPKDKTFYKAKFLLKDCEIASASASNKKNAKKEAADAAINTLFKLSTSHLPANVSSVQEEGLVKLSNLSKCEVQKNELQDKPSSSTDQNSNSNTSNLSQPSTEMPVKKPPFILNKAMYNLSLRDGFVILEKERLSANFQNNPTALKRTIVYESASFNHKSYEFEFEDIPGTMPPSKKATLLIAKAIVGTGVGETKEEAKAAACVDAFYNLKKKYYTLRIKEDYLEGFIVTRDQVFDGESFSSNVISESNIGCKMLKTMGWTGGGLLGKGIAEPIQATAKSSLGSGLGFQGSESHHDSPLFKKRMGAMLQDFCRSENYCDLVFSKDFTKEERKEIHQLAGRFHLHTQSRGVGDSRFLTIRHKYETTKLLNFLVRNGGSNSKFELIDDSGTTH